MIVGVGVDAVDVPRLERALARTRLLGGRLFTAAEQGRATASLAARVAAKEAVAKALGAPDGVQWQEIEVCSDERGRPDLGLSGRTAERAREQGIDTWHLSLTHDGDLAIAFVVAAATEGARCRH